VEVNIITMIFTAFVVFVCFLSVLRAMPDHNFLNGMYKKTLQTLLVTAVTLDKESSRRAEGRYNSLAGKYPGEVYIFYQPATKFWMSVMYKFRVSGFLPQTGHVTPRDMNKNRSFADFHSS
jgi:hypothetical protein